MQFIKVKIEDVSVKEKGAGFNKIYGAIYEAIDGFHKEAFKPNSEITAFDENGAIQWYKAVTVNTSISNAKNPLDSIGANIRAHYKGEDKIKALKYAVQYSKKQDGSQDKTKIDIFVRKLETAEVNDEPLDEIEAPDNSETTLEPTDEPV